MALWLQLRAARSIDPGRLRAAADRARNHYLRTANLDLEKIVNGRYELLGKWPGELFKTQETAARNGGLFTVRRENCLRLIAGKKTPTLVSLFVSTDMMTVGFVELGVDKMADAETHPGDEAFDLHAGPAQRLLA